MSGKSFGPGVHCSGIFDRLERFDAADRAHLFYAIENRWCWDCGEPQSEGDHDRCGASPDVTVQVQVNGYDPEAMLDALEREVRCRRHRGRP